MAGSDASDRFFGILSAIFDVGRESLRPDSSRESLEEWDSINHMHVMLALEEEFGVQFSDEEIADLASVSALMQAMAEKTGMHLSWA